MKVGFIGLGAIGYPMAKHVAEHFSAVVWNRTAARAEELAKKTGARVADSPAEVVAESEVTITCLPVSGTVFDIVKQCEWKEGHLLVDCTSGDPMVSREIADWLGSKGVGFVDAPVSGGTDGAERGDLTVMLGGEEPWLSRARDVVAPFSGTVQVVGGVGAGHALKAVNNALLAINIEAAGEGLAALKKFGVSPSTALEVINASSGRSNVTENLIPARVITREWPRTFKLALLDKDVGIAVDLIDAQGVPSGAMSVAKQAMEAARRELDEEADHVEAIKVIELRAGVEIR